MPGRGRCAHGPAHATALDPRLHVRGSGGTGRNSDQGPPVGRGSRGLSRQRRPPRRARRILLAPARLAGARPQRGVRAALPLSRLEIRCRRQCPRDDVRAAGKRVPGQAQAQGLSGARGRRFCVDLHGTHQRDARVRGAAVRADAGRAGQHPQDQGERQLGADHRRTDRFRSQLQPALLRHGAGARRWRQGDRSDLAAAVHRPRAALPGAAHELRLPLRRDPAPDRERRNRRLRPRHGLRRAVHLADSTEQHPPTRTSTSSPGTGPASRASTRRPGASSTSRGSASISTRITATSARARTISCRTAKR